MCMYVIHMHIEKTPYIEDTSNTLEYVCICMYVIFINSEYVYIYIYIHITTYKIIPIHIHIFNDHSIQHTLMYVASIYIYTWICLCIHTGIYPGI